MSLGPRAVIAQLAARRSHNPKVVSSILTHRSLLGGLHWHGTEPGAARHLQVCPCHGRGREASPRAAYPPPLPAPPLPRSPSLDPAPPLLPVLSPCCFDLPPPPRHTPPTAAHPPSHPPTLTPPFSLAPSMPHGRFPLPHPPTAPFAPPPLEPHRALDLAPALLRHARQVTRIVANVLGTSSGDSAAGSS